MAQSSASSVRCQVCDLPVEFINKRSNTEGPAACRACKKFFRRNRGRPVGALICISGTARCGVGKGSATQIASGVVWRMACPRCRFDKCLAVGLQIICNKEGKRNNVRAASSSSLESQQASDVEQGPLETAESYGDIPEELSLEVVSFSGPPLQPSMREFSVAETALQQTVNATSELSHSLALSPLRAHIRIFENDLEAWLSSMHQYEYMVKSVSAFIKSMPGFLDIPVEGRCVLFSKAMLPVIYADTNRLEPNPTAMAPQNSMQFIRYFPELSYSVQQSQSIWAAIKTWNPSHMEFSCMLAYLFIKTFWSTCAESSQNYPGRINDLQLAIEMALRQQCGANAEMLNSRRQHLFFIVDMLLNCAGRYNTAAVELQRRRPDLFTLSKVFTAVYSHNQKVITAQRREGDQSTSE